MKNKTVSLIISALMVILMLSCPVSASEYNKYQNFALKMGYVKNVDSVEVTRGEFAETVCKMLGVYRDTEQEEKDSWYNGLFEEDNTDTVIDSTGYTEAFSDVTGSHKNYQSIINVSNMGIMRGTDKDIFSPDSPITEQDAVKVMVSITGYWKKAQQRDGYPMGYISIAGEIGLLKDMNFKAEGNLTGDRLSVLVYNTMNVKLTYNRYEGDKLVFYTSDSETLLTRMHSIVKATGRVEANEFSALYSKEKAGKNTVIISGKQYNIDNALYTSDFLGYDVEFYYNTEENDIYYCYVAKDQEALSLKAGGFCDLKDGYFYYYTDDEKEKNDNVYVGANFNVIYNGSYLNEFTKDIFSFDFGDITLLKSSESDRYDTVIVNKYDSCIISGMKDSNTGIYVRYCPGKKTNLIDISNKTVRVFNKNMEQMSLDSISEDSVVDICAGDELVKVIIADDAKENVEFVSFGDDGENVFFTGNDGTEYTNSLDWYNSLEVKPVLGNIYTVYVNSFGKVVEIKSSSKSPDEVYNVFYKIFYKNEFSGEEIKIKAFTQSGKTENYVFDKETRVTSASETKKFNATKELYDYLFYNMKENDVFITSSDETGKVKKIEIPVQTNADNSLRVMSESEKVAYIRAPEAMFVNGTMLANAKVIFTVNTDETDEDYRFKVITTGRLSDGRTYKMKAYNRSKDSHIADAVVVYTDDSEADSAGEYDNYLYVVEKIKTERDEDGFPVSVMYGYSVQQTSNNLNPVIIRADMTLCPDGFNKVSDLFNTKTEMPKKGDILMIKNTTGVAEKIYMLYRADAVNNLNETGDLFGTLNVYSPDEGNTNPYYIDDNMNIRTSGADKYNAGTDRFFAGFVKDVENSKYITYTNTSLNLEEVNDGRYLTETTVIPNKIAVVSLDRFTVKSGTASDIKTYKKYGNDCSRIFLNTHSGRIYNMIIFNR